MKLTYLSTSTIPSRQANSVHVMKMCQAFARNGHDVILHARAPLDGSATDDGTVFSDYAVAPVFRLERVRSYRFNPLNVLRSARTAMKARGRDPDVVYTRDLWSAAASVRVGLPTVFEIHEYAAFERPLHGRTFRYVLASESLRRLVVISSVLRADVLREFPGLETKVVVAHDGADPVPDERLRAARDRARSERLQVGYVGHLYPGKGFELIPELARRVADADFHVVGGDRDTLDRLSQQELPANLRLHGFKTYGAAEEIRLQCDVLIAPFQRVISVTNRGQGDIARWTSPLKLFEYMAAAKPILCSDLPVLREILKHERTALLLPPEDAGAWAAALRTLAANPALRVRLGEAALRDFLARFTWQKRAEAVLAG